MHYIQKHILDELRTVKTMHYAKLNTDQVESGHFRYHLEQLIKDKYVEQLERGVYGLTTNGQQYVDKLSENTVNLTPMPKVITYTLLKAGDKYLLYTKPKQPYMGLINMLGGKLHEGETAQNASVREVYEKTGNRIEPPNLVGVFEVLINNSDDLLTHVIAYIFIANVNAVDYTTPSIQLLSNDDILAESKLAPDFLHIFKDIKDASSICVKTLEIKI